MRAKLHHTIIRVEDGHRHSRGGEEVVPLASVGKVLLLCEVARRIEDGTLRSTELLTTPQERVGGTGIVEHLPVRDWSIEELAALVATVSDNAGTNMLLETVELENVQKGAAHLGLEHTRIHDRIRRERTDLHPPHFASGTTDELAELMRALHAGRVHDPGTSRRVLTWMRRCTDRSLVADSIRHEPWGETVANKTGTDRGVRADVGVVEGERTVVYAAAALTAPGDERSAVEALRDVGVKVEELSRPQQGAESTTG